MIFILCGGLLLFTSCAESPTNDVPSTETPSTKAVFNTANVVRITFYAYYGSGKGSEVPEENMTEITKWLDSFTLDREATDADVPPGANTYYVEFEYVDGTIVKEGLDIIFLDGVRYLLEKDQYPDCFGEIISKTSLN